jgi:hypothetical protein
MTHVNTMDMQGDAVRWPRGGVQRKDVDDVHRLVGRARQHGQVRHGQVEVADDQRRHGEWFYHRRSLSEHGVASDHMEDFGRPVKQCPRKICVR